MARAVIRDHGEDLLHAALGCRPGAERLIEHRRGDRGARHVGRLGRDDRGRGVHDDGELLRFGRNVADRERVRRQDQATENVDLVAHDQFLGEALGDIRRDAAGILADELDLLAGDRVAMLFHVKLDGVVHLRRRVGELAGIRHDQADLHGLLRARRRHEQRGKQARDQCFAHKNSPPDTFVLVGGNLSHEGGRGRILSE